MQARAPSLHTPLVWAFEIHRLLHALSPSGHFTRQAASPCRSPSESALPGHSRASSLSVRQSKAPTRSLPFCESPTRFALRPIFLRQQYIRREPPPSAPSHATSPRITGTFIGRSERI